MIFIGIGLHGEFYAEGVTYNRYFFWEHVGEGWDLDVCES
jgi:hypothetical protein